MVRKRTQSESVQLGKKETQMTYERAVEIARACDNLPPLKEDYNE